jgi:hypothetical protein
MRNSCIKLNDTNVDIKNIINNENRKPAVP